MDCSFTLCRFALITAILRASSVSTKVDLRDDFYGTFSETVMVACCFSFSNFNNVPHTLAHTNTQNCGTVNIAVAIKYQK